MVIESTLFRWLLRRQWLFCSVLACLIPTTSIGRIMVKEHVIVLECEVLSAEQEEGKKLRIVAMGESLSGAWGIIMHLGPGVADRWPQAKKHHRLGAILEPLDEASRRILDDVFTQKFGRGKSQSIFKPRGYDGGFTRRLRELDKKAARFFLGDPGVDGDLLWNVEGTFDPKEKTLVLVVGEVRYGSF